MENTKEIQEEFVKALEGEKRKEKENNRDRYMHKVAVTASSHAELVLVIRPLMLFSTPILWELLLPSVTVAPFVPLQSLDKLPSNLLGVSLQMDGRDIFLNLSNVLHRELI